MSEETIKYLTDQLYAKDFKISEQKTKIKDLKTKLEEYVSKTEVNKIEKRLKTLEMENIAKDQKLSECHQKMDSMGLLDPPYSYKNLVVEQNTEVDRLLKYTSEKYKVKSISDIRDLIDKLAKSKTEDMNDAPNVGVSDGNARQNMLIQRTYRDKMLELNDKIMKQQSTIEELESTIEDKEKQFTRELKKKKFEIAELQEELEEASLKTKGKGNKNHTKELNEMKHKIDELNDSVEDLEKTISKRDKKIKELEEESEELRIQLRKYGESNEQAMYSHRVELSKLKKENDELKDSIAESSSKESVESQKKNKVIEELKREINNLKQSEEYLNKLYTEKKTKIDEYENQVGKLKLEINELNKNRITVGNQKQQETLKNTTPDWWKFHQNRSPSRDGTTKACPSCRQMFSSAELENHIKICL